MAASNVIWWKWSSAATALTVTLVGAWWISRPVKPPAIVSIDVKVTGIVQKTVTPIKAEIPEKLTLTPKPPNRK
jgi:hypothetical protein